MSEENDVVETDEVSEEGSSPHVDEVAGQETDTRTDAEKGLITEMQGLRGDINGFREENQKLAQENEYLRNTGNQEEEYTDPEDFATNGDIEKIIEKRLAPAEERLRMQEIEGIERSFSISNPDYEEVTNKYGKELLDANPDMGAVIMNSKNPASAYYNFSKTHPNYLKDKEENNKRETVSKITENLNSTPTVAGQGGSLSPTKVDWSKASNEDVEKYLDSKGIR